MIWPKFIYTFLFFTKFLTNEGRVE